MSKTRILIVDDSVVVRRLLDKALSVDPSLEVVGAVSNGRFALKRIQLGNIDLVTLDLEMPEMNGLETLIEIRKTHPRLPVIIFSRRTLRGAAVTLDALFYGASDYVTKPCAENKEAALEYIRNELIPKIKAFCPQQSLSKPHVARQPSLAKYQPALQVRKKVDIVAIGVSTGGPKALAALLPELSRFLSVPIVIVQHMPPLFTQRLAKSLAAQSAIKVREAVPGDILEAGHVLVAPGGYHLVLERAGTRIKAQTHQGPEENSCRPSVDVLFRSVAKIYGAGALGVILTGMGQDGLIGCEAIKAAGGQVFVQDKESSVIWGMPGFVAQAGLADKVLPLNQLAIEITRRIKNG
ncbi:MAG: chemotaxis response regulator protein-glutamate methylesterase [Candidatus Parabeggiatoa sp.]|nr:chemotaxis response regulator protein-glutamate methylesterase [Candidatus Parabeggiatoa sp.]